MSMKTLACACVVLLPFCTPAAAAGETPTLPEARYAAAASIQPIPNDDIEFGHHAHILKVVDLDDDGAPEIVYLLTAFNTGSSFDATNELVVMTRLTPDDKRGINPAPGLSPTTDADYAEIRKSGYADDTSVHIPGEVERLEVTGNGRIEVWLHSKEDSPICKRSSETIAGRKATTHCPPPGFHVWTYTWTPGKLERVECLDGAMQKVRCDPAHDRR